MKTIEGDYIPIDQPRFMEEEMMQSSEEALRYNLANILLKGTETTLIPLDAETLSENQIGLYLKKIHQDETIEYIELQEVKKIKGVTLCTDKTEDPELILQIHEEARISKKDYPKHQVIHFLTSEEKAFAACIIPISDTEGTPNLPLSALLIMPLESTIPEIRKLWISIQETMNTKKGKRGLENIPLVNHKDIKPRKKPSN